jgi:predicted Fe-Mo cluster-binding NifX family protein
MPSESNVNAKTVRVAIPSIDPGGLEAPRAEHFGRAECFTVVDIADGEIVGSEVVANPPHVDGGCMAPVLLLAEHCVDALVVSGIGGRPLAGVRQVGIQVHAGVGDDVETAARAFAAGQLPQVGPEHACHH